MSTKTETRTALHWLVVGYVSAGAAHWIEQTGGRVIYLSSEPPLLAVALAYDPAGAWTWSHGRQEHRQGVEYWSLGEIQESSTGITLRYGNSQNPRALAEYCSAETNYLLLPDEEIDPATGRVKEQSADDTPTTAEEPVLALGDLDDHPF